MLRILNKEIDLNESKILYNAPLTTENMEKYWQVYNGNWHIEDGWLTAENPGDYPEFIMSRENYPGNIILDFEARVVAPYDNDINFLLHSSMYEDKKDLADSYIMSIGGWWEGKAGIERSPDYNLYAASSLFKLEPGTTYRIQGGIVEDQLFIFIDGKLAIETKDANPIDSSVHSRVGFDAYASHLQIRNLVIRQACWKPIQLSYAELRKSPVRV